MGKRKKKQETTSLRSLSLRHHDSISTTKTASSSEKNAQHVANIGCMSGIFQFMSKYHTRHKFLTFGKKPEATKAPSQKLGNGKCKSHNNHNNLSAKLTLEMPRSPAIPAEIRQSSRTSSDSLTMAALTMQLNGVPETPLDPSIKNTCEINWATTEVAAEKRRKLLGALEKCDDDLQELKRIIKAVRDVQITPPKTPPFGGGRRLKEKAVEEEEAVSEEPSPVSVLDQHRLVARSPSIACSKRTREGEIRQNEHQQKHEQQLITMQHRSIALCFQDKPIVVRTSLQSLYIPAKTRRQLAIVATTPPTASPWSSATRESVIEVCKDVEFGLGREVEAVVLVIQYIIFGDLIDEIIKDMDCCFHYCSSVVYARDEACKRKLSF